MFNDFNLFSCDSFNSVYMFIRGVSMDNIFYNHYLRRDGAIYKDLAFMKSNSERVTYLYSLFFESEHARAKRFYLRLIKFINKRG